MRIKSLLMVLSCLSVAIGAHAATLEQEAGKKPNRTPSSIAVPKENIELAKKLLNDALKLLTLKVTPSCVATLHGELYAPLCSAEVAKLTDAQAANENNFDRREIGFLNSRGAIAEATSCAESEVQRLCREQTGRECSSVTFVYAYRRGAKCSVAAQADL
jgi:hypothetical protein